MSQPKAKAEHTPGPWSVEYHSSHDLRIVDGTPGTTIAVMANWLPQHHEERAANAALIASAPSLYKALVKIAEGLADTRSTPGQRMTRITKAEACEIASAAIAMAE